MATKTLIHPEKVESLFGLAVRLNRNEKTLEKVLVEAGVRVYEIRAAGRITKLVDGDDCARWLSANVVRVGTEEDPLTTLEKRLNALGKEMERIFGEMAEIKSSMPEVRT